jgi:hypothetical protein
MTFVLLIAGWLVAILCMILLAVDILRARGLKKPDKPARKRHLWPWRRRAAEKVPIDPTDAIDASAAADADADFRVRPWIRPAGVIALVLWEAFWISEIYEWSSQNEHPLQLPYVFLLAMMFGVPAAGYFMIRKWLAPNAEEP